MSGHVGSIMGPSWSYVGPSWGYVGPSWGYVGPSWVYVVPSWGQVGPKLGHLGLILGHLGAMLGLCWVKGCPPEVVMLDLTCFFRRAKNAKNTVNYGGGRGACGRRGPPGT